MSPDPLQSLPESAPLEKPQFFNPTRAQAAADGDRGERLEVQDFQPRWWPSRDRDRDEVLSRPRKPR